MAEYKLLADYSVITLSHITEEQFSLNSTIPFFSIPLPIL